MRRFAIALGFLICGVTTALAFTKVINEDMLIKGYLNVWGNTTLGDAATDTVTVTGTIQGATPLVFEGGGVDDAYELSLAIPTLTADAVFTFPSVTGTFFHSGADCTFLAGLTGGADISVATAGSATAGDSLDLVAGAGGAATGDGQAGGALTITAGAGSAKHSSGTNDGSGGVVTLVGGARGGSNGSAVQGYVAVGAPTVGSTKATNLLAVAGGFEVDGASRFDGTVAIGDVNTDTLTVTAFLLGASPLVFEGNTADDNETELAVTDPTADNVITVPNVTGTLLVTGADITFVANLTGGADISTAAAASGAAGSTLDLTAGAGGTAATDADGQAGGAATITGGAGTAKNGSGANDGSGGDVVLYGGARGGATGTAVQGIVRVGSPTVDSTKGQNLLAVAGGFEVDGASRFDGAMILGDGTADDITFTGYLASDVTIKTGLGGGFDLTCGAAAADTAGMSIDVTGQLGGTASTNQDGAAGGAVTLTAGAGSAKNGSGTNDGSGGVLTLLGGARGGSNGSAVHGYVAVGAPTVNATKATNLLAVAGALEVDGEVVLGTQTVTTALQNPGRGRFVICGEATTINNNTVYYGPDITLTVNGPGAGLKCDIDAVGNTTEATADEAVFTNQGVYVLGMTCRNEADANAEISYTLRTAAGATVPSVTCTIADNGRDCVADVQTTTAIAAGATVAIAAASTSSVGDNNGFICEVEVAF